MSDAASPPGDSCRLAVDYLPRESGAHRAALRVVARAANGPLELVLAGSGIAPRLALDPQRFGFEPLPVGGRSAGRALRIDSVGDAPMTVTEVSLEGPAAGDFRLERDRCSGRELEPGGDCSLRVAFAPAAEGERLAMLRVVSDAVTGAATINLSGDGLAAPEVALAPSRLQFGEATCRRAVRSSHADLQQSRRRPAGAGPGGAQGEAGGYDISKDGCSRRTLAAGDECSLQVVFAPTAEGSINRRLELPQAGGTGLSWGADLAGTAVAPRVEWSAGKLDWGETRVGAAGEPRDLRLRNAGSGTLRVDRVRLGRRRRRCLRSELPTAAPAGRSTRARAAIWRSPFAPRGWAGIGRSWPSRAVAPAARVSPSWPAAASPAASRPRPSGSSSAAYGSPRRAAAI